MLKRFLKPFVFFAKVLTFTFCQKITCVMSEQRNLAFILPAKNEERFIVKVLSSLHEAFPEAYVCVVVNGSSDNTVSRSRETLNKLKHDTGDFNIIELSQEGKGNAIRKGLSHCRAQNYILLDADGQHEPLESHKLLEKAASTSAGMVIGSRYLAYADRSKNARSRANHIFNRLFRWLVSVPLTDTLSGFRLLTGDFVSQLQLKSHHFEIEVELFFEARRLGESITEVPVKETRMASVNKLNLLRDGWKIVIFTVKKCFKNAGHQIKSKSLIY